MQMLRSLKDLKGYSLHALDGEIGKCSDFIFDDQRNELRLYDFYGRPHYWSR